MDAVTNVVLSAALALSASLTDGLKSLEQKDYDKAVVHLSKAADDKRGCNSLRALALLCRAHAHLGKKDAKDAKSDVLQLLELTEEDALVGEANSVFRAAGGTDKEMLPKENPERVWHRLLDDLGKGNLAAAKERCMGEYVQELPDIAGDMEPADRAQVIAEYVKNLAGYRIIEQRIGEGAERGKAWLVMTVPVQEGGDAPFVEYVLVLRKGRWLVSSCDSKDPGEVTAPHRAADSAANLRSLGVALAAYAKEHEGKFPPGLDDLRAKYVADPRIFLCRRPDTGEAIVYLYCPGLSNTENQAAIVVAEPRDQDGKRDVLYSNGSIGSLADEEFRRMAQTQKWNIPEPDKDADGKGMKKKIESLVDRLRKGNAPERRKALDELAGLGIAAHPLLEKYLRDDDPEVHETVKTLMGGNAEVSHGGTEPRR